LTFKGRGKNLFSGVSPKPSAGLSLHEEKRIQKRNRRVIDFRNFLPSTNA